MKKQIIELVKLVISIAFAALAPAALIYSRVMRDKLRPGTFVVGFLLFLNIFVLAMIKLHENHPKDDDDDEY